VHPGKRIDFNACCIKRSPGQIGLFFLNDAEIVRGRGETGYFNATSSRKRTVLQSTAPVVSHDRKQDEINAGNSPNEDLEFIEFPYSQSI